MMDHLFDQFDSPLFYGVPLIVPALVLPWAFYFSPSDRWAAHRAGTLQTWFINRFSYQIFLPLNSGAHKWAPMLAAMALLLLAMNLLGLLPYTFTPTTQLCLNLGFALPLWLATVLTGLRFKFNDSMAHLLPEGTPTALVPILIIVETISLAIRPFALAVRIFANLTAGHLLMALGSATLTYLISSASIAAIPAVLAIFALTILEIAVAIIQAYIFVLLLSLYLQENV
uniref:ATP synthase subunit a n=2 Tax=Trichonotus TaxID=270660 RepID=A0A679EPU9_9TELE|nr:ATP synthase F0 subunit 6 [Trichonotus setiger]BAX03920.1 ATPase subunit 6 [Trichonotus elegans]BBU26050.1 ATPase subunit 6 [Trichonotus elegans]